MVLISSVLHCILSHFSILLLNKVGYLFHDIIPRLFLLNRLRIVLNLEFSLGISLNPLIYASPDPLDSASLCTPYFWDSEHLCSHDHGLPYIRHPLCSSSIQRSPGLRQIFLPPVMVVWSLIHGSPRLCRSPNDLGERACISSKS